MKSPYTLGLFSLISASSVFAQDNLWTGDAGDNLLNNASNYVGTTAPGFQTGSTV